MYACAAVAVGQGEARYKPKKERRQEHPDFSARQLCCIGRVGRGSEEADVHPLVGRAEGREEDRDRPRGIWDSKQHCWDLSSKALALELLTGTSRLCSRCRGLWGIPAPCGTSQGTARMAEYNWSPWCCTSQRLCPLGDSRCWPVGCKVQKHVC